MMISRGVDISIAGGEEQILRAQSLGRFFFLSFFCFVIMRYLF